MSPPVRLFVALWPSVATRAACARVRDAWAWSPTARPVADDHLHVTLRFIGAVSARRVDEIGARLASGVGPFAVTLDRVSLWRNGIAALESSRPPASLARLHADIDAVVEAFGAADGARAYRPHVTLARVAQGSLAPPAVAPVDWSVDGYVLVESRDGRYAILRRYGLRSSRP